MTDQVGIHTTLQNTDPVKNGPKRKTLVLSTSDYSAISIDYPVGNNQLEANNQPQEDSMHPFEPVCISVTQKSKYDIGTAQSFKSNSLRRRHSSISSTSDQPKLGRPIRTPSLDSSRVAESSATNQKPPTGPPRHNSERRLSRPSSGKRNQGGNSVKSASTASLSCSDDVSVISCAEDAKEKAPIDLDCKDKLERATSAVKHLRNLSHHVRSKVDLECNHVHNSKMDLCRWCDIRPSTGSSKSSSSLSKKKNSPSVFNRLTKDGKDKMFRFFHCEDYTDYMYHYRIQYTVNNAGDLAKQAPVLGRDVPDPYLTKPSSVCIVTELNQTSQASFSLTSTRKSDDGQERSCPNLSPVRSLEETKRKQDVARVTPTQHIISVNDYMDSYLPQIQTVPRVPSRSDSSPALLGEHKSKSFVLSESVVSSSQFDGEIVGMKHKLPTETIYNFSMLCKPTAGEDIYNELKSGSSSYRNLNSNRQKKVTEAVATYKNNIETAIASPKCGASKTAHSDKGCHGCNRITSLIRGQRKVPPKPHDIKSKRDMPSQCKPLEEPSINVFHRLQKLPIG
ncbi:hypothetical protein LOTGIDRAFT_159476 [Lottia gigantea]|uniref:Uncharacterized protein n=1 Tax=Lottia gigantea TaxID=225164 RepID=V4ARJ0_LOTGI|nr:hypothetical protein LOTGIDRAFT_159476 [Lottia gigantea]ESO97445.1 hypothetical protein LOTGIDRAFT_159476 [Lottia gigantea]